MSDYPFKSEKLSPTIGLQIWGVDPSRSLSDAVIGALRHAWRISRSSALDAESRSLRHARICAICISTHGLCWGP